MALSRKEFEKFVQRQISQTDVLREEGRAEALKLISQMNDRLEGVVGRTNFDDFKIGTTKAALKELIDDFKKQYTGKLDGLEEKILELEAKFKVEIGNKADRPISTPQLIFPRRQLEIARNFRVDLISDLGDELLDTIANEISVGAGLGQTPDEVTARIFQNVTPLRRKDGSTIGALARSETIAKNELTRLLNITSDAQDKADAEFLRSIGETVLKAWQDSGQTNVRPTHREATLTYGVNGSIGPIPLNIAFQVGEARLMYPQQNTGHPEEEIG